MLVGPNTFAPLSWLCKKQGAVSHSSSEAEVISLDANVRQEGLPAQQLWSALLHVFSSEPVPERKVETRPFPAYNQSGPPLLGGDRYPTYDSGEIDFTQHPLLRDVDYVPANVKPLNPNARLFIFEDNEAVLKMCIKGRSLAMRHCPRTHRVDLDGMFDRMLHDTSIRMRFVGTKEQVADIFTKGSFSENTWRDLVDLLQVRKTTGICHLKPKGGNPGVNSIIESEDTIAAGYVGIGENKQNNALLDPYMFTFDSQSAPCSFAQEQCDPQFPARGCFAYCSEQPGSQGSPESITMDKSDVPKEGNLVMDPSLYDPDKEPSHYIFLMSEKQHSRLDATQQAVIDEYI